jgi:hypothetical protein
MEKLLGESLDKFNKSCRVFPRNPTKLVLHFSDFSVIFYGFYKIQKRPITIGDQVLLTGTSNYPKLHNHALTSHITP